MRAAHVNRGKLDFANHFLRQLISRKVKFSQKRTSARYGPAQGCRQNITARYSASVQRKTFHLHPRLPGLWSKVDNQEVEHTSILPAPSSEEPFLLPAHAGYSYYKAI